MIRRGAGFTLTELAIVLAIVGLLLGSLMYTLSAQVEQSNFASTQRRLDDARELLLTFAIVNGRLPCPASTTSNGDESPAGGGVCTDYYTGYLPARAIGLQPVDSAGYAVDAWGNRIRYAVSNTVLSQANVCAPSTPPAPPVPPAAPAFTNSANLKANGIACRPNDLLICAAWGGSTSTCGTAASVTNQNVIAAVVWSHGKNYASVVAGGADETANNKHRLPAVLNNHPVFVSHTPAPTGATGGEFDDLLLWIPASVLYGRLIAAGVLP